MASGSHGDASAVHSVRVVCVQRVTQEDDTWRHASGRPGAGVSSVLSWLTDSHPDSSFLSTSFIVVFMDTNSPCDTDYHVRT